MSDTMTVRERWRAALKFQALDRLPFWPKIDASYARAQAQPYCGMSVDELHAYIGSDPHAHTGAWYRENRTNTEIIEHKDGALWMTIFRAPQSDCRMIQAFDEGSQSWHPIEFPVKERDDIGVMTTMYRDVTVELDEKKLAEVRERVGQIGANAYVGATIGTSPLMDWVEHLAGVENAHFFLADYQDEVEELFDAMHTVLCRRTQVMADTCPVDALYMCENTSTTLISPDQYQRYCLKHVSDYSRITSQAGRTMILHMCGHLKALLPDIATLPVQGFEAFTSPTLGNTSLLDGRTDCPEVCLIGGTNATQWTRPAEQIIAQLEHDLDELPHHRGLVVTSAGVFTPLCTPETAKTVCEWVKAYPARWEADMAEVV
jgi:hypothetical protein